MRKRIISACLALCLALSLLPVNVWAAEDDQGITSITDLAAALTPSAGSAPTVRGSKITLEADVTLSEVLRISCDATIDLNSHIIDADGYYIQVDSGATVKFTESMGGGTITSSSDTAAVVAMRGCDLTISDISIQALNNAGAGIMLGEEPQDGTLQTKLELTKTTINSAGAGLYLAGMAETAITSSSISGACGIVTKSGKLSIGNGTVVNGNGAYREPAAVENGFNCDGSAILVENNSSRAGEMSIVIGNGAQLVSENSYAIREFQANGGSANTPKITIEEGGILTSKNSKLEAAVKTDSKAIALWNVTFDTGKSPNKTAPVQVLPGAVVPKPDDPTWDDKHSFVGWFKEDTHKIPWNFDDYKINSDVTIYAKWLDPYTVTFKSNGKEVSSETVAAGGKVNEPNPPTGVDGYRFDGWFKETDFKTAWKFETDTVTENITLYAKWQKTYTVTFNGPDGKTEPPAQTADEGSKVDPPKISDRTGYRLDGWFKEKDFKTAWKFETDTVTENITLYAKWQKTYTVTFDSKGGEPEPPVQTVDEGKPAKPPLAPTKKDFDFSGWYKEDACLNSWDFAYKINADVTLYAGWTKTPPTVKFHANGGTFASGGDTTEVKTDTEGKPTEFPADPSRTGYTFAGWYTEAEGGRLVTASTTFTESATVYAHWTVAITPSKPRTYTITFNANGGGSNVTLTTGTDGKLAALPDAPSRTGYTFDGWYTAPSGGTQITKDTVFQGHTTVYAHWKEGASQPSDPSNPSNPSNPSGVQYQVYAPSASSGGSFYISHTAAAEGQRVTITLTPWSGYQLYQLSVTNYVTGRQLSLSRVSTNVYAFTMPASSVSVAVTFTRSTSITPPQTINQSAGWYFSGSSIYHRTSGIVPSAQPLTRDMLISVLYSLDGSSHEEPAVWAVSNGIVPDVYSSLLWGSDKSLTREQTVMILYCYAEYKGYGTSQRASLAGYSDYSQIRAAAQHAMSWARATGLMTGTSATTLSPQANLTCEQANIVLSRFITSVVRR